MRPLISFINLYGLIFMRVKYFLLALCTIISLGFIGLAYASNPNNIVTLNCTGKGYPNVPNDFDLIQSSLNNAVSGETLKLVGTCQLDGRILHIKTSNLTITGAGANSNWSTVLKGMVDANGAPLGDKLAPDFIYFNRGFTIGPVPGFITNIKITGIKFEDLGKAIIVEPSISSAVSESSLCSNIIITSGNSSDITIDSNQFENDGSAAIFAHGANGNINIINNIFNKSGHAPFSNDIGLFGQVAGCYDSAGNLIGQSVGYLNSATVSNNTIQNDYSAVPIEILANKGVISKNNITAGPNIFAAIDDGIASALITGNTIDGGSLMYNGIFVDIPYVPFSQPRTALITLNNIKNSIPSVGTAIAVLGGIPGTKMQANLFYNISSADYLLCDADGSTNATTANLCYTNPFNPIASYNNSVLSINPGTTIMNLGSNNKILGPYIPASGP